MYRMARESNACILNRKKKGNDEGQFKYERSNASTGTDYVFSNIKERWSTRKMKIETWLESDQGM